MSRGEIDCDKVCRLCLAREQDVLLTDDLSKNIKYWEVVISFTTIGYGENDGLPQHICRMCASQLTNIHIFRQRCETSHETLLTSLGDHSIAVEYLNEEKYEVDDFNTIIVKEDEDMLEEHFDERDIIVESDPEAVDNPLDDKSTIQKVKTVGVKGTKTRSKKDHVADSKEKRIRRKNYQCNECGVLVESPSKLARHTRIHVFDNQKVLHSSKIGKVFSCKNCGMAFLKTKQLRIHLLSGRCKRMPEDSTEITARSSEDAVKAPRKAVKVQIVKEDRNTSIPGDSHPQKFQCYICNEISDCLDILETHMKDAHGRVGDPLFCCTRCSFTHESADEMIEHYRVSQTCGEEARSGEKDNNFKCDICDKQFRYKSSLKNHSVCHTGLKPFECDICFKRFTRKGEIIVHKRLHYDLRPYTCQDCNMSFRKSSNLIRHRVIHTGEANYQCHVCLRRFKWPTALKCHMNSHTGEKPYKCKYCPKAYTSNSGLIKHYANHPDIESELEVCN
ncbi:hypothetical protein DMENIID0001_023950 [Sergentomyia squamirostris]